MKLVELLARELKEWPEQAEYVVQEGDNELYYAWGAKPVYSGLSSWRDGADGDGAYFHCPNPGVLSTDYTTAIVTRQMWEAERVRSGGPTQWRDRIHAIDAEIHNPNTAHTAAVEACEEERIALVQRLELEGLQIIAAKTQPAEDPSDWSTWKAGDIVESLCSCQAGAQFTKGKLYVLRNDPRHAWAHVLQDDRGRNNGWGCTNFKLHSRAAK